MLVISHFTFSIFFAGNNINIYLIIHNNYLYGEKSGEFEGHLSKNILFDFIPFAKIGINLSLKNFESYFWYI